MCGLARGMDMVLRPVKKLCFWGYRLEGRRGGRWVGAWSIMRSRTRFSLSFPTFHFISFLFSSTPHVSRNACRNGWVTGNGMSGMYRALRHTIDITMLAAPPAPLIVIFFGPLGLNFLLLQYLAFFFILFLNLFKLDYTGCDRPTELMESTHDFASLVSVFPFLYPVPCRAQQKNSGKSAWAIAIF